jgi:hypothetical protein
VASGPVGFIAVGVRPVLIRGGLTEDQTQLAGLRLFAHVIDCILSESHRHGDQSLSAHRRSLSNRFEASPVRSTLRAAAASLLNAYFAATFPGLKSKGVFGKAAGPQTEVSVSTGDRFAIWGETYRTAPEARSVLWWRRNLRCRSGQNSLRMLAAISTPICTPSLETASCAVRLSA